MEQNLILQAIENLGKKLTEFAKPKNETKPVNMSVTLQDGTVLMVMSEDGEWVGKQVSREDGTPLEPGEYPLSDGRILVIGDQSTVAEVKEATAENEDMKAKEELEKAQARIKELESALEATASSAQQSEAKVKTLENKVNVDIKNLQDELNKIKNTTAGDDSKPDLGVKKGFNDGKEPVLDPMQAWFKKNILDKRNTD